MPKPKSKVPATACKDPLKLLTEDVITIAEVAREVPGRPNSATVWRWTNRGVCGVRLEIVKIGSRMFTSRQAVARFIAATSKARSDQADQTYQRATAG